MRQYWKIGAVAALLVVLGGAAAGVIMAQEPTGTPAATEDAGTTPDATDTNSDVEDKQARGEHFLELLAGNLGIGVDELQSAWRQTQLDLVDEALADGRITEEQATEIRDRIESGEAPLFPFGHHGRHHGGGPMLKGDVADFLSMTPRELFDALKGGQTLAQVAEAQGISVDDLKAHLLQEITDNVNQAVENGRITQERADEILANAGERIDNMINRTLPEKPDGMEDGGAAFPLAPGGLGGELF